jgi:hypothetical protein
MWTGAFYAYPWITGQFHRHSHPTCRDENEAKLRCKLTWTTFRKTGNDVPVTHRSPGSGDRQMEMKNDIGSHLDPLGCEIEWPKIRFFSRNRGRTATICRNPFGAGRIMCDIVNEGRMVKKNPT